MPLPWVRLDSNVASHDKMLRLLADQSPKRWQAATSYFCALGWSGGQGTDGHIPATALPFVHASRATAQLLVKYELWEEFVDGWMIHNFADRQELAVVSEAKKNLRHVASVKANCVRHHGPDCHCWKETTQ